MTSTSSTITTIQTSNSRIPCDKTLQHAIKLAILQDKPIIMDYWQGSIDKKVLIGVKENNEQLLVKSQDEYTSPIVKIYKSENEFIIATENSIYITDATIPKKKIS